MEQTLQRSFLFRKNMKKINYIIIKDFQIWEYVRLELDDFNVIKGSSNSGKSSLIRAINMVLNNDWHKSWLRQGEKDSIVEVYFTDGTSIKRIRGSQNYVEIKNDKDQSNKWSGFGNNYPEEVVKFLNIGEENCSYQFDQHFFLNRIIILCVRIPLRTNAMLGFYRVKPTVGRMVKKDIVIVVNCYVIYYAGRCPIGPCRVGG